MTSRREIQAGSASVIFRIRDQVSGNLRRIERGLKASTAKVNAFGKGISSVGGSLQSTGRRLTGFGLVAAAPLALASKSFADFDDQVRAVGAVSRASVSQLKRLGDSARLLGRTTSFTASEVAALQTELGRAGFKPDQIEKMTKSVLDLSRATGTDAALSAGIMSATLRQFSLDAGQAARVADVLTSAANGSFNTVEALGEALSYAGPIANDFGISIEEAAAAIGVLGNNSIQGSSAGTALRRILATLASESEKIKKTFGVDPRDAVGNLRPFAEVLGEIKDSISDLGNTEATSKLNDVFGLLAITSASVLGKNASEVARLQAELQGAAGAAEKTAKAMDAGLGGSFRKLQSAVEGFALSIGEAISGDLIKLVDRLSTQFGAATEFIEANADLVRSYAVAAVGVTALGAALTVVGGILSGLGVAIAAVAVTFSAFVTAISAVVGGLAALAAGIVALPAVLPAAIALVGALFIGLESLAVGVGTVIGSLESFGRSVRQSFGRIADALGSGGLQGAFRQTWAEAQHLGQIAAKQLEIAWTEMSLVVAQRMAFVTRAIAKMAKSVGGALSGIDPTGYASQLNAAGRVIELSVDLQLDLLRKQIRELNRELAEIERNPPTVMPDLNLDSLKSFAKDLYDVFAKAVNEVDPVKEARTASTAGGSGSGSGFPIQNRAVASGLLNFAPSPDPEGDEADRIIDRLDKGLDINSLPDSEEVKSPLTQLSEFAGRVTSGLADVGNRLGSSFAAVGDSVIGAIRTLIPPKPTGPTRSVIEPAPVPERPAPAPPVIVPPVRPDTGMSGLSEIERRIRAGLIMFDAAANAVGLFGGDQPTIQPAPDPSPAWANAVNEMGRRISSAIQDTVIGARDGALGLAGFRAKGGPVRPGNKPYMVGEEGPELFVPGSAGEIIANHDLAGMYADGSRGGGRIADAVIQSNSSNLIRQNAKAELDRLDKEIQKTFESITKKIRVMGAAGRRRLPRIDGRIDRSATLDQSLGARRMRDFQRRGVDQSVIDAYSRRQGMSRRQRLLNDRVADMQSRGVSDETIASYRKKYGGMGAGMAEANAMAGQAAMRNVPEVDLSQVPNLSEALTSATNSIVAAFNQNKMATDASKESTQQDVLTELKNITKNTGQAGRYY
ncbi:phage tail tape measure protein [Roseiconus nitratireducens]|uniref:Phage tail tape measure protein n=1 Tax=Roseiconus nitratireducens TaxID=2605748 RepID=A0A5M6DGJ8_9BACT|nr:phage tail tape measure protein [Roseiconus nitratireducens]KAA5545410.1 phage tail tape measure protein [Roseiconus nitratireducens]